MAVKPVPEGYHTVTPYLVVQEPERVIAFLQKTFDAKVLERHDAPDGSVRHAEIQLGDSKVMLGAAGGQWPPMPAVLYVYVPDVDEVYRRALAAGGTSLREPTDQFYGDRSGGVQDPGGNQWWVATHKEDVSPEEMKRRAAAQA